MDHIETKYQETLDYIYKFVDFSLTRNLQYSPEKFNLGPYDRPGREARAIRRMTTR